MNMHGPINFLHTFPHPIYATLSGSDFSICKAFFYRHLNPSDSGIHWMIINKTDDAFSK
jgi:hypothetical protein